MSSRQKKLKQQFNHFRYMYHDLGISQAWNIPRSTLRMFLFSVRERYQDNPYHNFKHCFSVAQVRTIFCCINKSPNISLAKMVHFPCIPVLYLWLAKKCKY